MPSYSPRYRRHAFAEEGQLLDSFVIEQVFSLDGLEAVSSTHTERIKRSSSHPTIAFKDGLVHTECTDGKVSVAMTHDSGFNGTLSLESWSTPNQECVAKKVIESERTASLSLKMDDTCDADGKSLFVVRMTNGNESTSGVVDCFEETIYREKDTDDEEDEINVIPDE
jgi:hypothetical protein